MSFAGWTLAQMGLMFAVGGTAITSLYLLRMRRRQVMVPFAELWDHVTRESESRQLWRRLRRVASWLLQLLVLGLICLALGDPRPDVWLREPRTLAIVLDRSASMSGPVGTAANRTRFDEALERARAELRALGPADRAVVIAADAEVTVPSPLGADGGRLIAGLEGLEPRPGEANMTQALALGRSAVAEHPGARILAITDGALDTPSLRAIGDCVASDIPCSVSTVSGPTDNVAITAFAARRYPADREHVEVLAEVHNLGDSTASVALDIQADGVTIGERELNLAAHESRREVLAGLDAARSRLIARLRPNGGEQPAKLGPSHDDVAYAIVPPLRPIEIALVTDGTNLFLEAALLTMDDHVRLTGVSPGDAITGTPNLDEADVVIFDVAAHPLPDPLPQTDLLVFDPWRLDESPVSIGLAKRVRRPFLTEASRKHALLDHVVLKDVNIARGTIFATEPGDEVLVRSLGEPIVVLREGAANVLVFGFDPRQSDLPMRMAFPMLVQNAVGYFEQRHAGFVASMQIGLSRELSLSEIGLAPDGVTRVELRGPAGDVPTTLAPVAQGRFRMRALDPGVHRVRTVDGDVAGAEVEIAVNQGSTEASSLVSRLPDLELGDEALAQAAPTPAPLGEGPLWTLLLLFVAGVFALEWSTYHRRVTV